MKPAALVALVVIATVAFAGEKKPDPRAFRMPAKSVKAKAAPKVEKPVVVKPQAVEDVKPVGEEKKPAAEETKPASEKAEPAVEKAKPVVEETKPVPVVPAFRFPNAPKAAPVAAPAPVEMPAAPDVTKKPATATPRSFTLPGAKPAAPKKKNPTTFRMPEKKRDPQGSR